MNIQSFHTVNPHLRISLSLKTKLLKFSTFFFVKVLLDIKLLRQPQPTMAMIFLAYK